MSIRRSVTDIARLHSGTVACWYHRWSIVIQRAVSTCFHPSLLVQAQYFLITWVKQQRIKTCAWYILRWHSKAQPRMRHTACFAKLPLPMPNNSCYIMKFKQSIILKLSKVHIWSLGHDNSVLLTWSESPWQSKNPIRGISMRDWPAKPGQREKRLDGGPKRKSGPKNSKLSKQRNKKNYDSHHHIYYQILRHITEYNCQMRQYMVTFYYGIWESWIGFVWTLHTLW